MFYLFLASFALIGGVLTVLTVDNLGTGVSVSVLGWHTPAMSLGLIIFLSFLVGALLLYAVSVIAARHDRSRIKELKKHIIDLEQQQQQPSPQPQMAMNSMNMGLGMPPPNMGPGMPPNMGPGMGPMNGMPPNSPQQRPPVINMPGMPGQR